MVSGRITILPLQQLSMIPMSVTPKKAWNTPYAQGTWVTTFVKAYAWSMDLLTLALRDVKLDEEMATRIAYAAALRGLPKV